MCVCLSVYVCVFVCVCVCVCVCLCVCVLTNLIKFSHRLSGLRADAINSKRIHVEEQGEKGRSEDEVTVGGQRAGGGVGGALLGMCAW